METQLETWGHYGIWGPPPFIEHLFMTLHLLSFFPSGVATVNTCGSAGGTGATTITITTPTDTAMVTRRTVRTTSRRSFDVTGSAQ